LPDDDRSAFPGDLERSRHALQDGRERVGGLPIEVSDCHVAFPIWLRAWRQAVPAGEVGISRGSSGHGNFSTGSASGEAANRIRSREKLRPLLSLQYTTEAWYCQL
jgi:hypothetical protein